MKKLILPLLLFPLLASAQPARAPEPYQSPATVAKRLKAQCAATPAQQRADCEKRARTEIRASIDKHNDRKKKGTLPPATARKGGPPPVPPRPPQK